MIVTRRIKATTFRKNGKLIHRKGYLKEVKASSAKRATAERKFFQPTVHTGWEHDMPMKTRRAKALRAHGGDRLATARGLQALANVSKTSSPKTSREARKDARYFFETHRKGK